MAYLHDESNFFIGDEEAYFGDGDEGFALATTPEHWQQQGITTKIPPLFDGKTSWFQYEELIHDWLDM